MRDKNINHISPRFGPDASATLCGDNVHTAWVQPYVFNIVRYKIGFIEYDAEEDHTSRFCYKCLHLRYPAYESKSVDDCIRMYVTNSYGVDTLEEFLELSLGE